MIRFATPRDAMNIVILGRAMHEESPRYRDARFDATKALALVDKLIGGDDGCAIVAEEAGELVGMMGGFVVEHFFSRAKTASDFVLYVRPEHRGSSVAPKLVKAFEAWAFGRGASDIVLGVSTEVEPERTAALYARLGYGRTGTTMIKRAIHV